MISRITGTLTRLNGLDAYVELGGLEYHIYVPDFVRRQLQTKVGEPVSLRTVDYIEGNPQKGGRMVPRLIGFQSEVELEFFELICSVDGVGVKKALNAMVKPVKDVALAIEEQDARLLAALPGIGPAMAERIIAKLRRKMTRFALMVQRDSAAEHATTHDVINDGHDALIALGHSAADAREKIEQALRSQGKFKSVDELIQAIYRNERKSG
ncbi:Holliday junction ATP-dependent DNA helicase RuvA [Caulifigura coniformis]|uniref:Holliday junction branch migration complex subunit RuvA n=1 Tax=Caulifigura coniformis TaxID=2527983 RepID=A0A517S9R7_9PLAN|nr:Holliday junction branch migration protein RuvA [Caulifigura coniformis]QDT52869.1 Holliday junction ATP-dependent DNA helicase RuvA [Caulifigura coniformis]